MNRYKIFCWLAAIFTINVCYASIDNSSVHIHINEQKARIGDLVKISFHITGDFITSVNWNLCDNLLTQNKQIDLLSSSSTITKSKIFEHELIFTSPMVCNVTIGPIPFLVTSSASKQIKYSGIYAVSFYKDKIPLTINDIKPISHIDYFDIAAIGIIALLPVIVILLVIKLHAVKSAAGKDLSPAKIKQLALENITRLEKSEVEHGHNNLRIYHIYYDILINFLNKVAFANHPDSHEVSILLRIDSHIPEGYQKEFLTELIKKSQILLYSGQNSGVSLSKTYLSDIKWYINNYPAEVS